jgi:predicted esterase
MRRLLKGVLIAAMVAGLAADASAQRRPMPGSPGGPGMNTKGVELRGYLLAETHEQMQYAVFVSSKVKKKNPSPLVIALHGLGGQPGIIIGQIRDQAEKHGYIVVAPMGHDPRGGYGAFPNGIGGPADPRASELSELDVRNVLKLALQEFNVDPRRIYLLGHSMGGGGALYLGIKYSGFWAAVGASAPAPGSATPDDLEKVRALPFILVHGDADPAVPVRFSRAWADKLKDLGMTYEYHELRGAGHEDAIFKGARYMFDFFDQHVRNP